MKTLSFLFFMTFTFASFGQSTAPKHKIDWLKKLEQFKIQPVAGIQLWSSYTHDAAQYDHSPGVHKYIPVDNRFNTQIRRTRLGIKGQPYRNLKFVFITSLDLVGHDVLAGTEGGVNNGGSPIFRIWNAFIQWKVDQKNDGLHLTAGYLPPQIGRESITAALRVTSMEKSWSQNYVRRHLTGTGPGRAMGLNLGGLFLNDEKDLGISYDVGVFNPVFQSLNGNSTGIKSSVLLSGRLAFHIGDPEFKNYTISRKVNYFGKRKGATIALAAARQGHTDLFENNTLLSIDWLMNWEDLNLSGEWSFANRTILNSISETLDNISTSFNTGFIRAGYNIHLKNGKIIEPVLLLMQMNGATVFENIKEAETANSFAGKDQYLEVGLHYYLNPNFKISLAYTLRSGDDGDTIILTNSNNYFFQNGAAAIKRGNWIGLGMLAIF